MTPTVAATGLLDLTGTLQNDGDGARQREVQGSDGRRQPAAFNDGHVTFDAEFSGQVGNGTTMDASLSYDLLGITPR